MVGLGDFQPEAVGFVFLVTTVSQDQGGDKEREKAREKNDER
jgi:hypothetical protein